MPTKNDSLTVTIQKHFFKVYIENKKQDYHSEFIEGLRLTIQYDAVCNNMQLRLGHVDLSSNQSIETRGVIGLWEAERSPEAISSVMHKMMRTLFRQWLEDRLPSDSYIYPIRIIKKEEEEQSITQTIFTPDMVCD